MKQTRRFRRSLLQRTLLRAARLVPAYGRLLDPALVRSRVHGPEDLHLVPFTRKEDVVGREQDFLCPGQTFSHLQHTSGTTGTRLFVFRSAEEQAAIMEFFSSPPSPPRKNGNLPGTLLHLEENYHGTSTRMPQPWRVLQGSSINTAALRNTLSFFDLVERFPDFFPPIRVVTGNDTSVTLLTASALNQGLDPRRWNLMALFTEGDLMPRDRRRWLCTHWNAPLFDRYSCVEQFGGATALSDEGCYRFDPHIVPEVVDLLDGTPTHHGHGVLVLTSLFPFVQLMPLIRYWTDDVVEIVNTDHSFSSLAVCIKGRLQDCLRHPVDGRLLLTPLDVRNALAPCDDLAFAGGRTHIDAGPETARRTGRPLYAMDAFLPADGDPLRVELRFATSNSLAPKQAERLAGSVRSRLLEGATDLVGRLVKSREATISCRAIACNDWPQPEQPHAPLVR